MTADEAADQAATALRVLAAWAHTNPYDVTAACRQHGVHHAYDTLGDAIALADPVGGPTHWSRTWAEYQDLDRSHQP